MGARGKFCSLKLKLRLNMGAVQKACSGTTRPGGESICGGGKSSNSNAGCEPSRIFYLSRFMDASIPRMKGAERHRGSKIKPLMFVRKH